MKIILIILGYLKWHYGQAILALWNIWGNFLFFIFEFFSIKLLFQNFFNPWKRMTDYYPKSFDLKKYFTIFLVNMITRIVGIIMRTALIIVSLTCYFLLLIAYPLALVIWLSLPVIIVSLILTGVFLIKK